MTLLLVERISTWFTLGVAVLFADLYHTMLKELQPFDGVCSFQQVLDRKEQLGP